MDKRDKSFFFCSVKNAAFIWPTLKLLQIANVIEFITVEYEIRILTSLNNTNRYVKRKNITKENKAEERQKFG